MKKFFGKIKAWWQKHKPTKRRLIQLYAFLLYNCNIKGFGSGSIYTGNTKYMCVPGLNCYSCPGAVGACPLGALQNALASSGTRAGFYVFGIIILFGLLLGRTICGFLCPIGLGQELLYKIRTPKLKKSKVTRVLSYFKYVVLAVLVVMIPLMYGGILPVPGFCKYICPAGTFEGAIGLLINPANADLYTKLGVLFTWKFGVLIALCVASVFIYRVFCRFLCPLGAIYGFFSKVAMLGVKLDKNKCTDCGLCLSKCKMDIKRVGDHECIQCGECIDICPAHAISWKGSKLFVHENAVPAPSEEKPLASLMRAPAAAAAEGAQTPVLGAETAVLNAETVAVGQIADDGTFAPVKENEGERRADRERKRNFWLQFAAWAAALALLLGAILYFNVFSDGGKPSEGTEVGNLCPEFTVSVYGGEDGETYSVTDTRGKVTVLNFWYTTCSSCVAEMPHFARVAEEYGETISVVAIHSTAVTENVEDFLAAKGWDKYNITFAQDHGTFAESETYLLLGGKRTFPMTLILDEEGVISYRVQGSVTYETLKAEIDKVIKQ